MIHNVGVYFYTKPSWQNKRTVAAVSSEDKRRALNAMEELRARGATTDDLMCRWDLYKNEQTNCFDSYTFSIKLVKLNISKWQHYTHLGCAIRQGPSLPTQPCSLTTGDVSPGLCDLSICQFWSFHLPIYLPILIAPSANFDLAILAFHS